MHPIVFSYLKNSEFQASQTELLFRNCWMGNALSNLRKFGSRSIDVISQSRKYCRSKWLWECCIFDEWRKIWGSFHVGPPQLSHLLYNWKWFDERDYVCYENQGIVSLILRRWRHWRFRNGRNYYWIVWYYRRNREPLTFFIQTEYTL